MSCSMSGCLVHRKGSHRHTETIFCSVQSRGPAAAMTTSHGLPAREQTQVYTESSCDRNRSLPGVARAEELTPGGRAWSVSAEGW